MVKKSYITDYSENIELSRFNVEICVSKDRYIIYNTLKDRMIELDKEYYNYYKNIIVPEEWIKLRFLENGIWKNRLVDEIEDIKMINIKKRYSADELNIIIKVNEEYASKNKKSILEIDDENVKIIKKFIESKISEKKTKKICLKWYGRETLLNTEPIFRIEKLLRDEFKNVEIYSSLLTNGYFLDKSIVEKFSETNIKKFFINFENIRYRQESVKKVYEKIVNNIEYIIKNTDYTVEIVVNFGYKKDNVEFILSEMKKRNILFDDKLRFSINRSKEFNFRYEKEMFFEENIRKHAVNVLDFYKILYSYGKKISFENNICGNFESYLIETDGSINKIILDVGKNFNFGTIDEKGKLSIKKENYYNKVFDSSFKFNDCRYCKVLPWCNERFGFFKFSVKNRCIPEKYIFEDIIRLYYEK
ncbi:MAG: hypothetical protein H7A30_02710 [Thermotogae bacterium]|nr:hypothetical protein [Thermotogota bacterium]